MVRFGILDHDSQYANRLVNFFSGRYGGQVEPFLFRSKEALLDTLQSSRLDLVLASSQMLPDPSEVGKTQVVYLTEEREVEQVHQCPALFRYQRGEALLRQIKGLAAQLSESGATYAAAGQGAILLFFGAGGGTGCSTAAMGCAGAMAAAGKKTVYLCLQSCGCVDHCLSGDGSGDLSRVLYEVKTFLGDRERQGNLALKLEGLLRYDGRLRFHYYDAFPLPLEAASMGGEELELLLKTLAGLFDVVVADMDGVYGPLLRTAMDCAGRIVVVSDGSDGVNRRLEKVVKAFSVLDDNEDLRLLQRTRILYNRFGSRSRQAQLSRSVTVLGAADNFSGGETRAVVEELSRRELYRSLLER